MSTARRLPSPRKLARFKIDHSDQRIVYEYRACPIPTATT